MTVALSHLRHKGKDWIRLTFEYDFTLKEYIKVFPGVTWSKTHRCFYVTRSEPVANRVVLYLRKGGYTVDFSALKNQPSKKNLPLPVAVQHDLSILEDYRNYLRGLRYSRSTVQGYGLFVSKFLVYLGSKPLREATANDVRLFTEWMVKHQKIAISTHRMMVSALKHLAYFYPECGIDASKLTRPAKSRKLPQVLSREQVIDLLRCTLNLKHRAILALIYSSGLRISELLQLKLEHLDVDRGQVLIRNAKGRKDRNVIMAKSILPLLQNYLVTYRPTVYFAEGVEGKAYSAESIRAFLKRSCRRAGIVKLVTPHTLRHSYATHLLENGIDLRYIQELLGHSRPETTMVYTHVTQKDLLSIESPLDSLLKSITKNDKEPKNILLSRNF